MAAKEKTNGLTFKRTLFGYDSKQVDEYVETLNTAYEMAHEEYTKICEQYSKLLEEYNKLESKESYLSETDLRIKTVEYLETLGQKIIAEANAQKDAIASEAKKLVEDAKTQIAVAELEARKIVEDARATAEEAARIDGEDDRLISAEDNGCCGDEVN
jgi:cell division septum initiation protein DivIVA